MTTWSKFNISSYTDYFLSDSMQLTTSWYRIGISDILYFSLNMQNIQYCVLNGSLVMCLIFIYVLLPLMHFKLVSNCLSFRKK
jgi:hypothetical protein